MSSMDESGPLLRRDRSGGQQGAAIKQMPADHRLAVAIVGTLLLLAVLVSPPTASFTARRAASADVLHASLGHAASVARMRMAPAPEATLALASSKTEPGDGVAAENPSQPRMLVKEGHLTLETWDAAGLSDNATGQCLLRSGWIHSKSVYDRSIDLVLKVPASQFDALIVALKALLQHGRGALKEERVSTQDVTNECVDLQGRACPRARARVRPSSCGCTCACA